MADFVRAGCPRRDDRRELLHPATVSERRLRLTRGGAQLVRSTIIRTCAISPEGKYWARIRYTPVCGCDRSRVNDRFRFAARPALRAPAFALPRAARARVDTRPEPGQAGAHKPLPSDELTPTGYRPALASRSCGGARVVLSE